MPEKNDPNWIAEKQKNDNYNRLREERVKKSVEILSDPPGARIEVNDEYVGDAPCTVEVVCDGHGMLITKFEFTALPRYPGHFVRSKTFYGFAQAPARLFFDMRIGRRAPSIDVNIID
jgi:hypothetical protein